MVNDDSISKMLKRDKRQEIFNALASASSHGSRPVVKSYFITRAAEKIFHGSKGSIDKVINVLGIYESSELIEIKENENRIFVDRESSLKYASENLELY